jgi:plastocyanin
MKPSAACLSQMGVDPHRPGEFRVPFVARRLVSAVLAAFILAAFIAPAAASAATATIKITNRLSPAELTVPAGTTIRFVNADGERHRMRSQSGPAEFDSHNLEPGQSYSMTLTATGTYTYLDEREDDDTRYHGTIVVGGAGGSASTAPSSGSGATSASVSMAGRSFSPSTVTIAAGGSVTFRNDDDREHTVTATNGSFNSGTLPEGGSWKRSFKGAGTFSYLCAIHPEMTGKVVVKGSGGGSAVAPAPKPKPSPSPTPTPTPMPATTGADAQIVDFAFSPTELTIPVGSTVTWRNAGEAPHTVTADDGSFDSDMIEAGGSWARTFESAGTFAYFCALHPDMAGVVTVTAGEAAAAAGKPSADPSAEPSPTPVAVAAPPVAPVASSPPEPAPETAAVAARSPAPDGELLARVGIVGLLIGGALLLFVRAVGGSARREEEPVS